MVRWLSMRSALKDFWNSTACAAGTSDRAFHPSRKVFNRPGVSVPTTVGFSTPDWSIHARPTSSTVALRPFTP